MSLRGRSDSLEQLPQRQDSLEDQLRDVRQVAVRMGCYDAADWIDRVHDRDPQFYPDANRAAS